MKLLLPILLAALPAFPNTITFSNTVPALFQGIEINLNNTTASLRAGQIGVLMDGSIPALMYCADPLVWLAGGPTPVTPVPDTLFTNGGRLAWLYNTYNPTVNSSWRAAALQLAIWEIVMDNNNDDLSGGSIRTTANTSANIVSLANSMLQASVGQSSTGIVFWVPNQGSSTSQTLLSAASVAAPEPSAALLLGVGLVALGVMRRRK